MTDKYEMRVSYTMQTIPEQRWDFGSETHEAVRMTGRWYLATKKTEESESMIESIQLPDGFDSLDMAIGYAIGKGWR